MKNIRFLALALVLCLFLCACSDSKTAIAPNISTEVFISEENTQAIEPTTDKTEPTVPETTAVPDMNTRLIESEAQYAALQDKLMNDSFLTQADMNELAGQQYTLWDNLLNELWAELTHTLPENQMQQLLQEERAWIRWKEHSVALAANYYDGGSLSILAANSRAAKLTQNRVYELAGILSSGVYPIPQTENSLYHQVFLPLASDQLPSLENLQLLLEFRGLSFTEEEGILQIQDPSFPEAAVYGSLSNESGAVTISQLIYNFAEDTTQKCVRVDFVPTPPTFYIDASVWDGGTEVATIEEMTDYLS